jgi:hypothetical protein
MVLYYYSFGPQVFLFLILCGPDGFFWRSLFSALKGPFYLLKGVAIEDGAGKG